jgi:uncharacterized protein
MTTRSRRLAVAFLIPAGIVLAAPAGAHFAGGHSAFDARSGPEPVQFRDFFGGSSSYPNNSYGPFRGDRRSSYPNNSNDPFGGDRRSSYPNSSYDPYNPSYQRPPQVYESLKPPAPRKMERPSTETVVVIGDTFGDWLGYGLEQAFAETPEIGIVRKIKSDLGLARDNPRLNAPEWSQTIKDLLATGKPGAIVVMLGVNDRLPLRDRVPAAIGTPTPPDSDHPAAATTEAQRRPQGGNYEFHTDRWAELYSKRIDDMIAALKTKGVPIVWVGLPAIRGTKSTSDMNYLDELYRAQAEKAGITYVDIWDGFVDEQGLYTQQGPDFQGQTRRLRTYDGVYFTKAGAEKLGHYVEHELRRVLMSHVLPVALPGPEEQSPAKAAIAPPAVGPVVPLNAISGGEGGELLGAASHQTGQESDPLATRVLKGGDAISAPRGRADDFSWPRADPSGSDAADGLAASPPAPANGSVGINDAENGNKNDTVKAEPKKNQSGQSVMQPPPHRVTIAKPLRPGDPLLGAPPRPPLPVGPAVSNSRSAQQPRSFPERGIH